MDAIDEVDENHGISVYPNPTPDQLVIDAQAVGSYKTAQLFDAAGKLVSDATWSISPLKHTLDLSQLPTGVYFLQVGRAEQSPLSFKIVKQ